MAKIPTHITRDNIALNAMLKILSNEKFFSELHEMSKDDKELTSRIVGYSYLMANSMMELGEKYREIDGDNKPSLPTPPPVEDVIELGKEAEKKGMY